MKRIRRQSIADRYYPIEAIAEVIATRRQPAIPVKSEKLAGGCTLFRFERKTAVVSKRKFAL